MKKKLIAILVFIFVSCNSKYEIKDGQVYYRFWSFGQGGWNELVLEDVELESFIVIYEEDNLYAKDESNVFFNNKIIPGADPKTFKPIKQGYAVDAERVYYYNDSIANSSPEEFEIIDKDFSKNYQNVFYRTKPLNVCSVADFYFVFPDERNILGCWSTDGCFYYFNNYKVPSNDYKNIVVYKGSHGISRDNEYVYEFDKNYFETNKRKVFLKEKGLIVEDTIDINTFTVENHMLKDKFGRIN